MQLEIKMTLFLMVFLRKTNTLDLNMKMENLGFREELKIIRVKNERDLVVGKMKILYKNT